MIQEEKDILIRDLSARLPFGVKVACSTSDSDHNWYNLELVDIKDNEVYITTFEPHYSNKYASIESIKPYLFPLSSMTEEQYEEFSLISGWDVDIEDVRQGKFSCIGYIGFDCLYDPVDWFNKNHFDWRGLIPKGLGKDATGLDIY